MLECCGIRSCHRWRRFHRLLFIQCG